MKKICTKRFSWKNACIVFLGIVIFDFLSGFLVSVGPDQESWGEWLFGVPFWIVNFPGLPFLHYMRDSTDGIFELMVLLTVLPFSALIWSVTAGYFFGHKYAA